MYQIKKYHIDGPLKGMITTEKTRVFFPVGFVAEKSFTCSGYVVIGRQRIIENKA